MASSKKTDSSDRIETLRLSASQMMWSMDIEITATSKSEIELRLTENSVSSRSEKATWKITEPPYDLVTQIGKALLDDADWQIMGLMHVHLDPGSSIDDEYLSLCWCESEFQIVGQFLSIVDPEERKEIHQIFNGFKDPVLLSSASLVLEWAEKEFLEWQDVIDQFGKPDGKFWWENISAYIEKNLREERETREVENRRRVEETFGFTEVVKDFVGLIEKFGRDIPSGYFLHMTKFPAPDPSQVSDEILMAWGRLDGKIPQGTDGMIAQIPGLSLNGQEDFVFAHWILKDEKEEKLKRIKKIDDLDARCALDKLRKIASEGHEKLSRRPGNQAEATIGRGLAKMKASLDPDA